MPLQITKNQLMPLNPGTTPPPREGYVVAARATSEPQNLSGITPMSALTFSAIWERLYVRVEDFRQ